MKTSNMANPWFQFKQFLIRQESTAFKVGTDGVLLGAWTDVSDVGSILDIGSGTGLLSLMLAQRSDARITAIEIDRDSCQQAEQNVMESLWHNRIKIIHCSLQEFTTDLKYDLLVSNPPFFQDSMRSSDHRRNLSRHDSRLTLEELARAVPPLMEERGRFCLILPVEETGIMEKLCSEMGLYPHRILKIRPKPGQAVIRHLTEFRLHRAEAVHRDELIIEYQTRHDFTEQYRELTKEFYLAF